MLGRVLRGVTYLGFAGAFGLLSVVAYWLLWPYHGMTKYEAVVSPTVVQGGLLRGDISYCVDTSVPLPMRVDREVVLTNHSVIFAVPDIQYTVTQRCETKSRVLGIPEFAPPGIYYLAVTTSVQVNPLRTIRQTWRTNTFEVVAK